MSGRMRASNQVAVVGYAQSPIERHANLPLGVIALQTAKAAVADAGLSVEQIDGFTASAMLPGGGAHSVVDGVSVVSPSWLGARLGGNPRYVAGFEGEAQLIGATALAVNALASGAADYVLMHRALHNPPGSYHASLMREVEGHWQWVAPQGLFSPMPTIALTYNEYALRYGASREALAAVAVEARKNGARVPWSYWYEKPLTTQEYFQAPMISDPICRLDCDIPVDGVAAFVLTTSDRARDLPNRPVYVTGYASGTQKSHRVSPMHRPLDDVMESGLELAQRLWERSGVGLDEVDLPLVYDGFSPLALFWLEALGICPLGEAHRFVVDGGIDSDSADGVPVLSGGGALGNGRMHGIAQMLECYLQLSGRAANRQRERATVGVACHAYPLQGGAVVYSAEPF